MCRLFFFWLSLPVTIVPAKKSRQNLRDSATNLKKSCSYFSHQQTKQDNVQQIRSDNGYKWMKEHYFHPMVRHSIQQMSLRCFPSSSSNEINHQQPFTVNRCLTLIVCSGILAYICFVLLFIAHCPTCRYAFVCLVRYECSAPQEGSCIGLNSEY